MNKALTKSIKHWQENLMMLMLNKLSGAEDIKQDINISSDACALCKKYDNCFNCPVYKIGGCVCSPWKQVNELMYCSYAEDQKTWIFYKKLYEAIVAEINFLESLTKE
jgi:hypothetical protein